MIPYERFEDAEEAKKKENIAIIRKRENEEMKKSKWLKTAFRQTFNENKSNHTQ